MDDKNPFAPPVERVPFRLMLDARSFQNLAGESRAKAEFLCELCWTDAVDALWGWGGDPIAGDIRQAELGPIKEGHRTVRRVGEPTGGFIGGFFYWDQFSEWADQNDLQGDDRDWFLHYAPLSFFADRHDWHYLVTADERLLREVSGDRGWFRKGQQRVTSIGEALFLAGQAMKAHGVVFYESPQPGYTITTWSNSMYQYLAQDMISSRRRIFEAAREPGEPQDSFHRTDRETFCVSIFNRVADLLRGCDRIAATNGLPEGRGGVEEVLYEIRALVGNAAGIFDAVAVLAQTLFSISLVHDQEASLTRDTFRRDLRRAGATHLADEAGKQCPLFRFLWSLRNPILHKGGLPGYTLHTGKGQFHRATLTEDQLSKLKILCADRSQTLAEWGLDDEVPGLGPSVDGYAFSRQLSITTIAALDRLLGSLADDRGAPDISTTWTSEERKAVQRFRWLSGFPTT